MTIANPPANGWNISIAGRGYKTDTSFEPYRREAFRHKSIQPTRDSLHFTNIPDDGTVSTEGLWRREVRDWSLGAGQTYFDRKKSDDARFFRSKGVNPWTQWNLSLLPDVEQQYASTASGIVKSIAAGGYVYLAENNNNVGQVRFLNTWNAAQPVQGLSAALVQGTCSSTTSINGSGGSAVSVPCSTGDLPTGSFAGYGYCASGSPFYFTFTGVSGSGLTGVKAYGTSGQTITSGNVLYFNAAEFSGTSPYYVGQKVSVFGSNPMFNISNQKVLYSTSTSFVVHLPTQGSLHAMEGTFTGYTASTATLVLNVAGRFMDMTTDGTNIYILTTHGVYTTVAGTTTALKFVWGGNSPAALTGTNFSRPYWSPNLSTTPLTGVISWAGNKPMLALNNVAAWGASANPGASIFDLSNHSASSNNYGGFVASLEDYLVAPLNTSDTVFNVQNAGTNFNVNGYYTIDDEVIKVTGISGTQLTVNRGQLGSTAARHALGSILQTPPAGLQVTSTSEYLYTHNSVHWNWSGITQSTGQIYYAGYNNLAGATAPAAIYRSTYVGSASQSTSSTTPGVNSGTTGFLTTPIVALPLPNGEYPTAIKAYLNYVFVGTNLGIRMCLTLNANDPTGNAGDLNSGPLLPPITDSVALPVTAIMGYGQYIYFAWNNYDWEGQLSCGLGRLDLTQFIDTQAPAYASDLMVNGYAAQNTLTVYLANGAIYGQYTPHVPHQPIPLANDVVTAGTNTTFAITGSWTTVASVDTDNGYVYFDNPATVSSLASGTVTTSGITTINPLSGDQASITVGTVSGSFSATGGVIYDSTGGFYMSYTSYSGGTFYGLNTLGADANTASVGNGDTITAVATATVNIPTTTAVGSVSGGVTWLDWDPITQTPLISLSKTTLQGAGSGMSASIVSLGSPTNVTTATVLRPGIPTILPVASTANFSPQGGGGLATGGVTNYPFSYTGIVNNTLVGVTTDPPSANITPTQVQATEILLTGTNTVSQGEQVNISGCSNLAFNRSNLNIISTSGNAIVLQNPGLDPSATGTGANVVTSSVYNGFIYTGSTTSTVASGSVDSGLITFGIPDNKNAVILDVNTANVYGGTGLSAGTPTLTTTTSVSIPITLVSNTPNINGGTAEVIDAAFNSYSFTYTGYSGGALTGCQMTVGSYLQPLQEQTSLTLQTGWTINFNTSSVTFALTSDAATTLTVGPYAGSATKGSITFPQQFGEQYRLMTTLNAAPEPTPYTNVSPVMNRVALKALPGIPSGIMISVVLNLFEQVETDDGLWQAFDPYVEYDFLEAIRQSQQVVQYVEGPRTFNVTVDMIDWLPERHRPPNVGGYSGDMVVYLKTLTG